MTAGGRGVPWGRVPGSRSRADSWRIRGLYEQVALHKRLFAGDRWAASAPEQGIRTTPAGDALRELEVDYRNMEQMFFSAPPLFEEIVEGLGQLEAAINAMV